MTKVCEWDPEAGAQRERDMTPDEEAQRLADIAAASAPTVERYTAALEAMYDAVAAERHYDNRFTCALRAGYAGPFRAEGTTFATWMDTCNAQAYTTMAEVLGGQRAYPSIAELLASMPALVWP